MPTFRPIALTVAILTALTACHPGNPLPGNIQPAPPSQGAPDKPGEPAVNPAQSLKITVTLPAGVHQRLRAQRRMGIQGMAGRATFGIRTNFLAEVGNSDSARRLMELGIIQGNGSNPTAIDQSISRAEYVSVLVRAFGQESTAALAAGVPAFADSSVSSHWAAGHIALAKNLIQGAGGLPSSLPGGFDPNGRPTPNEAMALLSAFLGIPQPSTLPPASQLFQNLADKNLQGSLSLPDSLMASDLLNVLAPTLIQGGSTPAQLNTLLASFPDPMIFNLAHGQERLAPFLNGIWTNADGTLTYSVAVNNEQIEALVQSAADQVFAPVISIEDTAGQAILLASVPQYGEMAFSPQSTAEILLAQACLQWQSLAPTQTPDIRRVNLQLLETIRNEGNRSGLAALTDRITNLLRSSSGVSLEDDPTLNTLLTSFASSLANDQPLTPQVVSTAAQKAASRSGGGGGGSSSSGHTLATSVTVTNGSHGAGEDWDNPPD